MLPIYAGAHASLTRPSSAAKPSKSRKKASKQNADDDELDEEATFKVEGLSASDAIWFPLLAGLTLGGLYLIIKWLEDPSILNTILNWYFAIFGVLGLAKLFNDCSKVATSYIFPARYFHDGQIWQFDEFRRIAKSRSAPFRVRTSPLPGSFSKVPLPPFFHRFLWALRRSYPTLCLRFHLRPYNKTHAHITPSNLLGILAAFSLILYYNLISRPWYLTNTLGFAFAYNAIQLISPTTSTTGSLLLTSLFVYDVYFVFFTPLMVTVATSLDIPAKLLFPRPPGPDGDPAKQHLSMLGLGDVVLPGVMIGFALRLDLYLHYRKQQKSVSINKPNEGNLTVSDEVKFIETTPRSSADEKRSATDSHDTDRPTLQKTASSPSRHASDRVRSSEIIFKPQYLLATGHWGTRYWTSKSLFSSPDYSYRGTQFPKPYFYASLTGYIVGMLATLYIMQVTGHAQPALLYLVPCVLISFWGTAVLRSEIREVWRFDESDKANGTGAKTEDEKNDKKRGRKEKKEVKATSSPPGTTTVDFVNLDMKVGITESRATKGCVRKEQIEKPRPWIMEEFILGKMGKGE
ncbi:MAG: hypothetical protein LQ343_000773 [Gyalolechia ehrenbergii]|nr:MAG: hypothetical protein LQ343_000773 [Gyalolechia ehrenbergii]